MEAQEVLILTFNLCLITFRTQSFDVVLRHIGQIDETITIKSGRKSQTDE